MAAAGALLLALSGSGAQAASPPAGRTAAPVEAPPVEAPPVVARSVVAASPGWRVLPVTAARLGSSHRRGCPVAVADLRLVEVLHTGFDGRTHRGELVLHRDAAADVQRVFRSLHAARFPVQRVVTVDRYGADDDRSMAANSTSAYNCRRTTGGRTWSEHAYGRAVDLNPVQNPYVRGPVVAPKAGRAYLDRGHVRPGMVVEPGPVVRAFAAVGWSWGGHYRTLRDYQHFSRTGR